MSEIQKLLELTDNVDAKEVLDLINYLENMEKYLTDLQDFDTDEIVFNIPEWHPLYDRDDMDAWIDIFTEIQVLLCDDS